MSKTYQCPKCEDTCHIFKHENKIVLKCSICGAREITEDELKKLKDAWRSGHK